MILLYNTEWKAPTPMRFDIFQQCCNEHFVLKLAHFAFLRLKRGPFLSFFLPRRAIGPKYCSTNDFMVAVLLVHSLEEPACFCPQGQRDPTQLV